jgi:hypothetical protein
MNKALISFTLLLAPVALIGVYAPVPQPEQGSAVTVSLIGGVHYDTNVLGSPTDEIESAVYLLNPRIMVGQGTDSQTSFTGYYDLKAFFYSDRPTQDSLYNHEVNGTLNHQFSEAARLLVSDTYYVIDDPESIDAGILQTDQSLDRNRFNARLRFDASEQVNVVLKYRNNNLGYDNSDLAVLLDRNESRAGFELGYQMQPNARLVFEYRYQQIQYDVSATLKDSESSFFLGGFDWDPSPKTKISTRFGLEDRDRSVSTDDSSANATVMVLHKYDNRSFFSLGVSYDIQETTNPVNYSDEEVLAFFANIQHALSGSVYLGASVYYDDVELRPQAATTKINYNALRIGFNLTYEPRPSWSVIFSLDYDDVSSSDIFRVQDRLRIGVSARYSFGL